MKNRSAKDRICEALRSNIENSIITSGQVLSVDRLAEQFGVSRTPVREALLSLENEGFVKVAPRVGYTVNPLNIAELLDIYNVRLLIEKEAVMLAVPRMTREDIERLRMLLPSEAEGYSAKNNREFHTAIARASGSKLLPEILESILWRRYRGSILDSHVLHREESARKAHKAILDAMASGDVELATAEMVLHITKIKHRIELLIQQGVGGNMIIMGGGSAHGIDEIHT